MDTEEHRVLMAHKVLKVLRAKMVCKEIEVI
jgi:hypothetical protein